MDFNREEFFADIMRMARCFIEASSGRIQVVRAEQDKKPRTNTEAGMFIKLDGERLGRDFEVYTFMAENYHPGVPMSELTAISILLMAKGLGKVVDKATPIFKSFVKYLGTPNQRERWKAIWEGGKIKEYKDFNVEVPGENPGKQGLDMSHFRKEKK